MPVSHLVDHQRTGLFNEAYCDVLGRPKIGRGDSAGTLKVIGLILTTSLFNSYDMVVCYHLL